MATHFKPEGEGNRSTIGSLRLRASLRYLFPFFAFLLLIGCQGGPSTSKREKAMDGDIFLGKPMPTFRMVDLADKVYTNESLAGKIVILDFWATWCQPCRDAAPYLEKIQKKYESKGVVVIGVNVSEGDQPGESAQSKEKVTEYAAHRSATYTLTIGNDALAATCGITGLPTFIVIDRKGIVREVQVGAQNLTAFLDDAIGAILEEK